MKDKISSGTESEENEEEKKNHKSNKKTSARIRYKKAFEECPLVDSFKKLKTTQIFTLDNLASIDQTVQSSLAKSQNLSMDRGEKVPLNILDNHGQLNESIHQEAVLE